MNPKYFMYQDSIERWGHEIGFYFEGEMMTKWLMIKCIEWKLRRMSNAQIQQFNIWYRNSDIKKNVDKRKAKK